MLGIENQQHIHAMPLRHMIYDAMGYLKDTRNYKRLDVKSSDPDEFLSKMRKEDRMQPFFQIIK